MKDYKLNLILFPFISNIKGDNPQLYIHYCNKNLFKDYYIHFSVFFKMIEKYGNEIKLDKIINHPKTIWWHSNFSKFELKKNNSINFNNQVTFILKYSQKNCDVINKMNSLFGKIKKTHSFHKEYVDFIKNIEIIKWFKQSLDF